MCKKKRQDRFQSREKMKLHKTQLLTNPHFCGIILTQLRRTVARYVAVRYYREESPGFTGQDS